MRIFPSQMVNMRAATPVALLGIYVGISALVFYQLANAWPNIGQWKQGLLLLLCPAIVLTALRLSRPRTRSRARRVLEWLVAVPLGVFLATLLTGFASMISFNNFQKHYAAFVAEVHSNLPTPCASAWAFLDNPTLLAYNRAADVDERAPVTLYYSAERFVASLPGGSIDIDGSTIYYDSHSGGWHRFHNDDRLERERYGALIVDLSECRL